MRRSRVDDFPSTSDDELLAWSRDLVASRPRPRRTEPLRARPRTYLGTAELFAEIERRAAAAAGG
jgi:hypothetical protein